ncbi:MAG: hypothetical protein K2W82_05960 [Candidatus Obscuribacterales bacterium]|nr:hypothetical protein [Candidatus Obscuribacterales bacterium]
MKRQFVITGLVLFTLCPQTLAVPKPDTTVQTTKRSFKLGRYTIEQEIAGNTVLTFKMIKNKDVLFNCARFKNQEAILSGDGYRFIDPFAETASSSVLDIDMKPVAKDMNGDGIPELVFDYHTGKSHNTMIMSLYEVKPSMIFNSGYVEFADLNHDRKPELLSAQPLSYLGANASPMLVLQWNGQAYAPSPLNVKKNVDLDKIVSAVRLKKEAASKKVKMKPPGTESAEEFQAVWSAMLDLIYSGNAKQARELLNCLYPGNKPIMIYDANLKNSKIQKYSKDQLWNDFTSKISEESIYWSFLRRINPELKRL